MVQQTENSGPSTSQRIVFELCHLVEPITAVADQLERGNTERLYVFLNRVGVDESSVSSLEEFERYAKTIGEAWSTIEQTVIEGDEGDEGVPPGEIDDLLGAFEDIFSVVSKMDEIDLPDGGDIRVDSLADNVFDYLIVRYLERYHYRVYSGLSISGVVVDGMPPEIDLTKLGDFVQNPNELVMNFAGWGSQEFEDDFLLYFLRQLIGEFGLSTSVETPVSEYAGLADHLDLPPQSPAGSSSTDPSSLTLLNEQIDMIAFRKTGSSGNIVVGVSIVAIPGSQGASLPGIGIVPFASGSLSVSEDLGGGWAFEASASAEQDDWGFSILPKNKQDPTPKVDLRTLGGRRDLAGTDVHGEAEASYSPQNKQYTTLLGDPEGTRLALSSISAGTVVDYDGESLTVKVELPTSGTFEIKPKGGFLEKIFTKPFAFDFDATVGWSNKDGVYFEGGGTLEASIPMHLDIGVGSIEELFLALNPQSPDSDFALETATSPKISLGPLKGSVKRMGLKADVSFPENRDGSMGPLDLEIGFRPPDGLALAVDTGPVTGGGFMIFEPEKHRYAGGLDLQFSSWGLKVVGLLKTKLPGTDGFSLLLLVTADLPPIQLGFGFVMNGIGGLAGIHRGFKKKPLGKAVRSGNLDSVLFPEDVVENADQIITDLRAIFPPKANKHVFGPMLRLGWGTPVIITAEMGVLIAIPDWKIALLGKFMVDLPDEEVALIDINLAIVGVLDIPNEELAIDASLYDSRIVQWTVSGDMAMRLSWGSDARFMLSVGGFHPTFEPPKGFPELDRVKASMSPPGGNPRLEYSGYLAVTPNTAQVGARAVLHGEFGPAVVHGEMRFDALFRFGPFGFVVSVHAGISVKVKGMGLSLQLDGSLSGPQPYRVKGKLKIEIFLLSVTVKVNATFGSKGGSKELPRATVLPELHDALETKANWMAQKPESDQFVTLRDPDAGSRTGEEGQTGGGGGGGAPEKKDTLLAHPLGTLGVRQQIVPLATDIEKYGNAKPVHTRFTLSKLSVAGVGENLGGDGGGQPDLCEKFATAKFEKLSDSERLEAEDFHPLPAGRRVENGVVHYVGDDESEASLLSWATLDYESSVIDEENENYRTIEDDVDEDWEGRLDIATGHQLAEQSAVGMAETRTTGPRQYANPDQELMVSVDEQRYAVAHRDTLKRLAVDGNPATGRTRVEARNRLDAYVAANDVDPDRLQVVGVQELAGNGGGEQP